MDLKVLIPLCDSDVAPRFDLATEALVIELPGAEDTPRERHIVLPHASPDELCRLALAEGVSAVICGGIEDEYYQYLTWKKIDVFDSVIGSSRGAIARLRDGTLRSGETIAEAS